jgi:microcystin-dependent protein
LTGSQLHEPKGVATAALGEVYVADGTGSGNWANVGTSSFTGMIADFPTPVAPTGWLECDGSVVSTTTYSALYDVMTIQTNGTRISGNPIITSIASTSNMKAGYYVFGTGITSGTTILTVDSANQITLSGNAGSSGTSTIVVSPWLLNTGTIKLPDVTTSGRYRRSRTSSTAVGQVQADQNKAHTHLVSGNTAAGTSHSHANFLTDSGHVHGWAASSPITGNSTISVNNTGGSPVPNLTAAVMSSASANISITNAAEGSHTHPVSITSASDGGTEVRPLSIIVMTCVKT